MKTITIKQDDLFKNIENLINDELNIWFKSDLKQREILKVAILKDFIKELNKNLINNKNVNYDFENNTWIFKVDDDFKRSN